MARYLMLRRSAKADEDSAKAEHHHHHHHHYEKGVTGNDDIANIQSAKTAMVGMDAYPKEWASYGTSAGGLMQVVATEFAALQAAKNNEDHRLIMKKLDDLSNACAYAMSKM